MTRDLDTPLEFALGVVEPARAQYMDVIHDMCFVLVHMPNSIPKRRN